MCKASQLILVVFDVASLPLHACTSIDLCGTNPSLRCWDAASGHSSVRTWCYQVHLNQQGCVIVHTTLLSLVPGLSDGSESKQQICHIQWHGVSTKAAGSKPALSHLVSLYLHCLQCLTNIAVPLRQADTLPTWLPHRTGVESKGGGRSTTP